MRTPECCLARLGGVVLIFAAQAAMMVPAKCAAQTSAQEKKDSKVAGLGFLANAEQFTHYTMKFRETKGQAKSIEHAVKGSYLNSRSYDIRVLKDGKNLLYQGFAPLPDHEKKIPAGNGWKVAVLGNSEQHLSDGGMAMVYNPSFKQISLSSKRTKLAIEGYTPLSLMGAPGLEDDLKDTDQSHALDLGSQQMDGRSVLGLRVTKKPIRKVPPFEFRTEYWFDPAQGYLPIRYLRSWDDKPRTYRFVTVANQYSKGRWHPDKIVEIDLTDGRDLVDFTEVLVLDLQLEKPPRAEFKVTVPAGTSVYEINGNDKYVRLKQQETIGLDDLSRLFGLLTEVAQNPLADTAVARSGMSWERWTGLFLGLGLAGTGFVYYRRRRLTAA